MLRFPHLPRPLRILLLAAQPRLAPGAFTLLQGLVDSATQPDWDEFLLLTAHHRLGALIFHALQTLPLTGVPEPVRTRLQHGATRNAFSALRAQAECLRLVQCFAAAGQSLTLLKGISLSQLLYGTPNARNVGDIDLLTTPDRMLQKEALLEEAGYTRLNPEAALTPRRLASYQRFWKDFTFGGSDSGFELDLHWRFFNHRLHPANRLLRSATYETLEVFGSRMPVLSPRDLFVYTAAHGVSDAFTYLKSLADVAGFLQLLTPVQLEEGLKHAASFELLPQVSAAVHLANDWMQTGIASPLLLPEDERFSRTLRRRVEKALTEQHWKPDRSFTSPAQWLRLESQLVPGGTPELLKRFLWRPRVWTRFNLPDHLFPLYGLLGLLLPPRAHSPEEAVAAGHSQAAPRTPLESPNAAGSSGVSKSPPKT